MNFLPELEIQARFSKVYKFCKRVGSISRYSTFNFAFASICTKKDPRKHKPMDFIPENKDEVIRESASHKLYRTLANPLIRVWRDSNQTKAPTSRFHIGNYLRYINWVNNEMV